MSPSPTTDETKPRTADSAAEKKKEEPEAAPVEEEQVRVDKPREDCDTKPPFSKKADGYVHINKGRKGGEASNAGNTKGPSSNISGAITPADSQNKSESTDNKAASQQPTPKRGVTICPVSDTILAPKQPTAVIKGPINNEQQHQIAMMNVFQSHVGMTVLKPHQMPHFWETNESHTPTCEEMHRLMSTYGSIRRQNKSTSKECDTIKYDKSFKRRFKRYFPDLYERFTRHVFTGKYYPNAGHDAEIQYRKMMRSGKRCTSVRNNLLFDSQQQQQQQSNAKEATNSNAVQQSPPKERKMMRFNPCKECNECKRTECGKCEKCRKKVKFGGNRIKSSGVCIERTCKCRISVDGMFQQYRMTAPPGSMGLSVGFPGTNDRLIYKDPPWISGFHGRDVFNSTMKVGDLLWSINGERVIHPNDLTNCKHYDREVVFARRLKKPKLTEFRKKEIERASRDSIQSKKPENVWATEDAKILFGSDNPKELLEERVEFLRNVNKKEDGYKCAVHPDSETAIPYPNSEIMKIRHRALYLIRMYTIALEKMDLVYYLCWHQNGKFVKREDCTTDLFTWDDVCNQTIKEMTALGIELYTTAHTLTNKLHKTFRKSGFLTPQTHRTGYIFIFQYYPLVKEMFIQWVKKNKSQMTLSTLQQAVATEILPTVLEKANENGDDVNSPGYKLLAKMAASPPKNDTMKVWLDTLGLKYDMYNSRRGTQWSEKKRAEQQKFHSENGSSKKRKQPPEEATNDMDEDVDEYESQSDFNNAFIGNNHEV